MPVALTVDLLNYNNTSNSLNLLHVLVVYHGQIVAAPSPSVSLIQNIKDPQMQRQIAV
jgi:hypothetical protein